MIPVLVIFFREGLEASLIVGVILSYLQKIGWNSLTRAIWWGVLAAVVLDAALGVALFHIVRHYDGSRVQTVLEGTTYFVAMVILTGMSFWMKAQSRDIRRSLERQVDLAISRGTLFALVGLAFVTVGREGLETVFFTLAMAFRTPLLALAGGAAIGFGLALAVDVLIFRAGRRVPLGVFFNVLGGVLLVFAAALLADGIEDFQSLGWLPVMTQVVWNSGHLLSENGVLGDILHNFTGYAESPTVLQLGAYIVYLVGAFGTYFGWWGRMRTRVLGSSVREGEPV
ncbi:MAG: FTR1 family iron permease [Clostridia bacterium]